MFYGLFFGSFLARLGMQATGLASLGSCCGSCAGCPAALRWSLLSERINCVKCVWLEVVGYLIVGVIASLLSKLGKEIFGGSLAAGHSTQGLCWTMTQAGFTITVWTHLDGVLVRAQWSWAALGLTQWWCNFEPAMMVSCLSTAVSLTWVRTRDRQAPAHAEAWRPSAAQRSSGHDWTGPAVGVSLSGWAGELCALKSLRERSHVEYPARTFCSGASVGLSGGLTRPYCRLLSGTAGLRMASILTFSGLWSLCSSSSSGQWSSAWSSASETRL